MAQWLVALLTAAAVVPAAPPADPFGRGYLGIRMADTEQLSVSQVDPDTAADRAGLKAGDVLVRVGALAPQRFADVIAHVKGFRPGTALRVEILRGGRPRTLTVTLMARPASADLPTRFTPDD